MVMNRFILDTDPATAAMYHCDKHVVKMILEESQMLSTAHRIIDGVEVAGKSKTGRNVKRWTLTDERNESLYQATHVNHPCTQWSMQTNNNYNWSVCLLSDLLKEYTYRYGKRHKCGELFDLLSKPPRNISFGPLTQFPQAMPEDCKREKAVDGYRAYYINHKARFAKWTNRSVPDWFTCS
jgi:hypothetical protein